MTGGGGRGEQEKGEEEEEEKEKTRRVREACGGSRKEGKRIEDWRGMSRGRAGSGKEGKKGRRGKKEKRSFWTPMTSSIPKSQRLLDHHFIKPSQV